MAGNSYFRETLQMSEGARRFLTSEALYGIGIGLYTLVLNYYLLAMGLTEAKVGGIVSTGILVMGGLAIPVSLLAGKAGRKPLLVSGVFAVAGGVALFASGSGEIRFYAAQILISMGLCCIETTEVQLLFSYSRSRKEETRSFSLMFAVFTMFVGAGTLLGGMIPGWLSGSADPEGAAAGYRAVLFCAAGTLAALGLLRALWLPPEHRGGRMAEANSEGGLTAQAAGSRQSAGSAATPQESGRGPKTFVWRKPSRTVWTLACYTFISGISFAMIGGFLNVMVKHRTGWEDSAISLLLTANGILLFIASLLTPWVLERFGTAKAFRWVYLGNALLAFVLSMQLPVAMFAMLLLMRGGGFTMLSNMIDSQSMSALHERDRNIYAGMRSVFRSVGSAGATYTAGLLLAGGRVELPFAVTGVMLLLGYGYYYKFVQPLLQHKETGGHTA